MIDYKIIITGVVMMFVGFILYKNPVKTNTQMALDCIDTARTKDIICECLKKYEIKDTLNCK